MLHFDGLFPGPEPPTAGSRAAVAAHREELEGPTTRIYNYVLGLWGGKKKSQPLQFSSFYKEVNWGPERQSDSVEVIQTIDNLVTKVF